MGSCCIVLTPLREASYFLIHSSMLKPCRRESSVVPHGQVKVSVQPGSRRLLLPVEELVSRAGEGTMSLRTMATWHS